MEQSEKYRGYGPAQVRVLIASGKWPSGLTNEALAWLDAQDDLERVRSSASQAEQNLMARQARNAATEAATAAKIAILLAIISIIVALLAWVFPRTSESPHPTPQNEARQTR